MADENPLARTLSLAAHELRTPVTVVAGYLRMVLRDQAGTLSERQRKMLEEAERSCGRLSALVAEMSDLGRLEARELALARQDLDLPVLLAEQAARMTEGLDRGVRLDVRGADRPMLVAGDRSRLSSAFGALMHSALRERGDAGIVPVDCSLISEAGTTWAMVTIGERTAGLSGADDRLPFNEWLGGQGFALPMARRIIEAHGGTIWSISNAESRATSTCRLPLRV